MTIKPTTIEELQRLAKIAVASKAFGNISPELAAVAIMTGSELGLGPMASLRGFHVMNGKLVASAGLIQGQAVSHPDCEWFRCAEASDKRVVYETKRKGSDPSSRTYTMDDAQRAGLTRNPTWKKYPQQMLQARCASSLAREVYPDAVSGLLGDDVASDAPERAPQPRKERGGAKWQAPHPAADPRHIDAIVQAQHAGRFTVPETVWDKANSTDTELRAAAASWAMETIKKRWATQGILSDERGDISQAWKTAVQALVECEAYQNTGNAQQALRREATNHKGDGDLTREVIALAFAGVLVAREDEPTQEVA